MQKINVHYQGWGDDLHLGQLAAQDGDVFFEYTLEAQRAGLELSPLRLGLQKATYTGFPRHQLELPGLIADALPDGFGMLLMDKLFRKRGIRLDAVTALDRLAFVGATAMGALTFSPATETPLPVADVDLLKLADEARLALKDGASEAVLLHMAKIGGSPHGARPKALLNYDKARGIMTTAESNTGEPWLIKFPAVGEHKEVCAVEDMYAKLATEALIDIPPTEYFDLGPKMSAFGIKRFDRENGLRVPTITAAGALDLDFRISGALDYTALLRLTKRITGDSREVMKAFERCVFNVIFNNRDDHAKNFSFRLNRAREYLLSPAYDLTFSYGYGGEHQTDVVGEGKHITRAHLLALANQTDIKARAAEDAIDRIDAVAANVPKFAKEFAIRTQTRKALCIQISANRESIARGNLS